MADFKNDDGEHGIAAAPNINMETFPTSEDALPAEAATVADNPPYTIFSDRWRMIIVIIASFAATFTTFGSNIYFPAIPIMAEDLKVTPEAINLSVTSYMILQGLSPIVWGAITDVYGRRITYICTFIVFLGACVGLAETKSYAQLVVLRGVQSAGSASTVAIGAGVVGDITTREERGGFMGIFQAGLLTPLAIAPVVGGVLAEKLGWRSIFWFLTIYAGAFLAILVLFLPETLRALVGNGSVPARGLAQTPYTWLRQRKQRKLSIESSKPVKIDLLGPVRMLFSAEFAFVIIFFSIYYTVWLMTLTSMATLFERTYGLSELRIGLTFIANGAGCIIGTLLTGKFLDYDYQRIKESYTGNLDDFPLERARLRTIWLWSGLQMVAQLVFGWTLDRGVNLSVPVICTFFLGWSATSIQSVIMTFVVDVHPKKSSSAVAAFYSARCVVGAGGTAAVMPIVNAIGVGYAFTALTGVMSIALSLILVQMRYGPKWRRQREQNETAT